SREGGNPWTPAFAGVTTVGRNNALLKRIEVLLCLLALSVCGLVHAEDGHELWLRYPKLSGELAAQLERHAVSYWVSGNFFPTFMLARQELERGVGAMAGRPLKYDPFSANADGSIGLTVGGDRGLAEFGHSEVLLQGDGFALYAVTRNGHHQLVVWAKTHVGLLYGTFELLRQFQTNPHIDQLALVSNPATQLRMLDHWDNLDGKIERGYAGRSIFDWWRLPDYVDPRLTDYARANASIGINGIVLNNVNANARVLTHDYLLKVAAIAKVMEPWGIKVYLSARFSAPKEIGGLNTADPLDPQVRKWWQDKTDEIYNTVLNFGGFLVKANSEGQPGPGDYGRTHADGANMLAAALARHHGVVMWRAFVYSDVNPEDRAKQAYSEFKPLDGKFADNVLVQVKNGAIDFQPREPFHPLFGAMPKTPLMPELQITKEYLGFATHLVYLGKLFEEVLQADTYAHGAGSTVAKIADGSLEHHALTGIAGVANIGSDRDWSGSDFNQANWYAFGRLAWNPYDSSERIVREWLAQTFSADPAFIEQATQIMLRSREAAVDYMTPLGLAHQMGTGHHYGPAPWVNDQKRPEWNPVYYNRADANGIGFDRTATGSDALAQYFPQAAAQWADVNTIDDKYLLWFHHVPWQHKLKNGQTVWQALIDHYDHGVAEVEAMQQQWEGLQSYVDAERHDKTKRFLQIQRNEAQWWRDASIAYFQSVSKLPLPAGVRPPEHDLGYYQALRFPDAP
ncbi:MAG TPA: alpha-glucuronidase family glycosyl hydrolase, partial [Candidatus Acidoferrum sp.]|nr:alpha-glucuronidase family glycosyl hydrolase [Candidatus Acidoferrum sp.]